MSGVNFLSNRSTHWSSNPIHIVDFEGSQRTGVVEYGVATLHGGEVVVTSTKLHRARVPVPTRDTYCHGLTTSELSGLPYFETEWDYWISLRRSGLLAAHNATVEAGLLRDTWARPAAVPSIVGEVGMVAEWGPWIDTCRLARAWVPELPDHRLGTLVEVFRLESSLEALALKHCPRSRRRYHCALFDALAAALVLKALCGLKGKTLVTLSELVRDSLNATAADDFIQGELGL